MQVVKKTGKLCHTGIVKKVRYPMLRLKINSEKTANNTPCFLSQLNKEQYARCMATD